MTNENEEVIREQKRTARSRFGALRRSISEEERQRLDDALVRNTLSSQVFQVADTILCYYPVKSEPNVLPIAHHALAMGKTVAFPISHKEDSRLSFHEISDLSQLTVGTYGIPEPDAALPEVKEFQNALCIVPALAYDAKGHRLGYGGGYYDRFLANYNGAAAILIYSDLFSKELPTDRYDQTVDIIITEEGGALNG